MSALPIRRRNRRFPTIFRPRVSDDLAAAQAEYGGGASPYADLSSFLNRPVFDRGSLPEMQAPTLSKIGTAQANVRRPFPGFIDTGMADRIGRNQEISNLRDALRQDISTSEEAARSERSEITKSLEDRIAELRTGVDTETEALRQAGVDERADLLRQIEEGDRLVREAQTAAIGDLTDRQGSLIGDLQSRIGTLSTDLTDINSVIEQNFTDLVARQEESASSLSAIQEAAQTATDQELGILGQQAERVQDEIGGLAQQLESLSGTQNEIDSLNQQLESLYTDVESGNAAQSETIRSETAQLISGLEQQIGGLADNLGALPIESIQAQLASVNDQTKQFQQAVDSAAGERADLSARLEALQASGLTQEDLSSLSQNIAGQRQADIAAALDPIAQQRQTAIASAINPIQQQIETLRGEIPQQQNIDVEALRQQITDQVMSQLPQQQTTAPAETTTPPITVGSAEGQQGISVEPEGDVLAADMNLSDGQADALGLFDDPRPMQQFDPSSEIRDTVAVPTPRQHQMTSRAGAFIPETTVAPTASNAFSSLVGLKAANVPQNQTPVVGNIAVRADRTPKPRATIPTPPPVPKVKRELPIKKPLPVMAPPFRFNRFRR